MTPEILAIIMFITTLALLLFGFPVAFTLAGSALIFAFIGDFLDIFNFRMLFFFPQRIYGIMINEALVAVPLFIFMGVMLEKTKIASKLLDSIGDLYLAGCPVEGYFYGKKSGHYLNNQLLKKLLSNPDNYELK